jgi:hypothetical protein
MIDQQVEMIVSQMGQNVDADEVKEKTWSGAILQNSMKRESEKKMELKPMVFCFRLIW